MPVFPVQPTTPHHARINLTSAQQEAYDGIAKDVADLLESCPLEKKEEFTNYLHRFQNLFGRFIEEQGKDIKWNEIEPPSSEIYQYAELIEPAIGVTEMLNKLVSICLYILL